MSYTALARKYRPLRFGDLVGQDHVAKTLGNAIAQDRVAHAFLFAGVRGVGKTSSARILARSLNCETGPTLTPCGHCGPCEDILRGLDLDVLEIDGASNNSVDDVRRLQESIPFRPARDRFKIIIVDEVHMLSSGAFNALLKTLEEPPSHVKFIFATTEAHKVPVTIRSRCQRYDFRLISAEVISRQLQAVLKAEGIDAEHEALTLIAREAAGSMRDALTLLDQALASAEKLDGAPRIRAGDLIETLGIAGVALVQTCALGVAKGDPHLVLQNLADVQSRGLDAAQFAKDLAEWSRDIVALRVAGPGTRMTFLSSEGGEQALRQLDSVSTVEIQRMFHGLAELTGDVAQSSMPFLVLEMGLVRLATRPALADLSALLRGEVTSTANKTQAKLKEPERNLQARSFTPAAPKRQDPAVAPRPPLEEVTTVATNATVPIAPLPVAASGSVTTMPSATRAAGIGAPEENSTSRVSQDIALTDVALKVEELRVQQPLLRAPVSEAPPEISESSLPLTVAPVPAALPFLHDRESEPPPAPYVSKRPPVLSLGTEQEITWENLVALVAENNPAIAAILEHGEPLDISPQLVRLRYAKASFFATQAMSKETKEAVLEAAQRAFGTRPSVQIETVGAPSEASPATKTLAASESERKAIRKEALEKRALNHPKVLETVEILSKSGTAKMEVLLDDES